MIPVMWLPAFVVLLLLAACDSADSGPPASSGPIGTPVTVVNASQRRVEVLESSVGRLETPAAPAVAAETAGRVEAVQVDAGHEVAEGDLLAQLFRTSALREERRGDDEKERSCDRDDWK